MAKVQRLLSESIDRAILADLRADPSDSYWLAHLALVGAEGAGSWLTACPEDAARDIESPLFRIALRRRCRVRVQESDTPCMACGGLMDSWGDHALACPCRGDRTIRHNVIRNLVFQEARDAGCAPEQEKGNLLPGRSLEDGAPPRQDAPPNSDEQRRPADIWLPRGVGERVAGPAALDFAIASGLRADRVERAKEGGQAIADDYAAVKCAHLDTGQKC